MTKFSKFAYIAGTASAVTAGSWMMAYWGRNHGGHAYIQDYAYLATARAERRALANKLTVLPETYRVPENLMDGTLALAATNAWTNLVIVPPLHRASYLTLTNDDAMARDGSWIVPGIWPEDGSAIEIQTNLYAWPAGYSVVGAITNFPSTDVVLSPYVHSWIPKAASNIYPRMQYRWMWTHGYHCVEGYTNLVWSGTAERSNTLSQVRRVDVDASIVSAWSSASANIDYGPASPTLGYFEWRQYYEAEAESYSEWTGIVYQAYAYLDAEYPAGDVGLAPAMHPRFYASGSDACVVTQAWAVVSASFSLYGGEGLPETDRTNMQARVESDFVEVFEAPGAEVSWIIDGSSLETVAFRAYLIPLSQTSPEDPLYPLWTFTPARSYASIAKAQDIVFGTFPAAPPIEGRPQVFGSLNLQGILVKGDFETYHASTNTWSDCGYYEP